MLCIVSQFTNSSKATLCVHVIHATDYLHVVCSYASIPANGVLTNCGQAV